MHYPRAPGIIAPIPEFPGLKNPPGIDSLAVSEVQITHLLTFVQICM